MTQIDQLVKILKPNQSPNVCYPWEEMLVKGPWEYKISFQGFLCLACFLPLSREQCWYPWKPLKVLALGGSGDLLVEQGAAF